MRASPLKRSFIDSIIVGYGQMTWFSVLKCSFLISRETICWLPTRIIYWLPYCISRSGK
ncbi:hypothetical protein M6B38_325255 [Iris pallida]|uniref:Uncharacterized protein n=1 Tax=Iris pallida TaxID=29817 RepID=A0AAX6H2A8_IRIPA|nr:hypothetical protein M6B38_124255 [Iris pallida]KAJ6835149.1 hypothetical protein M6B38_124260 [Iris pallida]KAJ6836758.1 hypothetical protein M6B38_325255 [Iris pallida]